MTNVRIQKALKAAGVVAVIGVGVAAAGISSWAAQAAGVTLHAARRNLPAAAVLLSEESAFPQPFPAGSRGQSSCLRTFSKRG